MDSAFSNDWRARCVALVEIHGTAHVMGSGMLGCFSQAVDGSEGLVPFFLLVCAITRKMSARPLSVSMPEGNQVRLPLLHIAGGIAAQG